MHPTKPLIERLTRDVLLYGFGDVLSRASLFLTMPIYTRVFTVQEYGVLNFATAAVGLFGIVLALGGEATYARFFFAANGDTERRTLTSTWLIFLSLWGSSLVLICIPFAAQLSLWSFNVHSFELLFQISLLTVPVALINSICAQILRNQFRVALFIVLNVLSVFTGITLSLVAVLYLNLGLAGLLAGTLAAMLVMLPVRLWTARRLIRLQLSMEVLRDCLLYGVPLMLAGLAYWMMTVSDRLLLGKLGSLDEVGLYSVAATLVAPMLVLVAAFGQAWWPHAFQLFENVNELAPYIFGRVATYLLVGFGLLAVSITVFAPEYLYAFAAPTFERAIIAIPPLTLGAVAYATTQITAAGMYVTQKSQYIGILAWLAAIVNIGLNFLLIPHLGMLGAAWAMAITFGALTLGYGIISQRLWRVAFERQRIVGAIAVTVLFTLAAPHIPVFSPLIAVPLKVAYVLAYVCSLFLVGSLDVREVVALRSFHVSRWIIDAAGAHE